MLMEQNPPFDEFKEGDLVWTTYGLPFDDDYGPEQVYQARVVAVVDNTQSKGLGIHYVLYVTTCVEDYLDFKPAAGVWRSKVAWSQARDAARQQLVAEREQFQAVKRKLNEQL